MAATTKTEMLAENLAMHLTQRLATAANPTPIYKRYDANNDVYLTVQSDSELDAIIQLLQQPAAQSGATNMFGIAQTVFTPHLLKVGIEGGAKAQGTATLTNVVGAVPSSGTLTCANVAVAAAASATATLNNVTGSVRSTQTVTLVNAVATKKLTIAGHDFEAVAAAPAGDQWLQTGDDNADAAALAAAINASTDVAIQDVVWATVAANVVTVHSVVPGAAGDLITIVSDDPSIAVGGAGTLAGGVNGDYLTIDGVNFLAMTLAPPAGMGATLSDGEWLMTGNDEADATALAAAINNSTNVAIVGIVTATPAGAVVTVEADTAGTAGNAITFTETGATITVTGGGTLTGGVDADTCTVNGALFTAVSGAAGANEFQVVPADDDATASNLADAINASADAGVAGLITATVNTNIVTVTADDKYATHNAYTLAETGNGITRSGANFAGYIAGNQLLINGVIFLCVAASPTGNEWLAAADNAAATNLAAAINGSASVGVAGVVTASVSTKVVTVKAVASGIAGNNITFTKVGNPVVLAPLTGVLAGGADTSLPYPVLIAVIAECARIGCEMKVYSDNGLAIADLSDETKLIATFRDLNGLMAGV